LYASKYEEIRQLATIQCVKRIENEVQGDGIRDAKGSQVTEIATNQIDCQSMSGNERGRCVCVVTGRSCSSEEQRCRSAVDDDQSVGTGRRPVTAAVSAAATVAAARGAASAQSPARGASSADATAAAGGVAVAA